MRYNKNYGKILLTVFFFIMIGVIMAKSHPLKICINIVSIFKQEMISDEKSELQQDVTGRIETELDKVEEDFVENMWHKELFLNLSGKMARNMNMQGFYSNLGIYVTDDYYIVGRYSYTTTDYEYEQIIDFKDWLDEKGINLLYVNAPIKYVEDELLMEEFGVATYSNQNADLLLQRISDAGIDYIDLRDNLKEDGMNVYDMFYRTDHHWNTESGLWATKVIAEALNEKCGYSIDTHVYDNSQYTFTEYKNCWLGEQGRKLAVSYVGLEDYTLIKPKFDTDFIITRDGSGTREGTFDIMIDETILKPNKDIYDGPSWHYTYMSNGIHESEVQNRNVKEGKVLILADSYSQVIVPFLAIGVSDVKTLLLRYYEKSLREFIETNEFDTVIILYAQSMIGNHDNPASINYDMYTFK